MASLQEGTLLGNGRYRVSREINRGGTAVVYEGIDLASSRVVALKVMSVKEGKASVPVKGVKREIEYAASMQHENIVQLLDYFVDEQQIVLVWELISGPDLLDLLNECGGRLDEPTAVFYFRQLLQGIMFIHEMGLCHRDLKPENCMVERKTGILKIIDFGLSKHQQSAVTLGVGTPDYMAPELLGNGTMQTLQERRVGQYDPKACDVWAMGVLLFLLVTGTYPFEDPLRPQNVVATLQNIMSGRIRPLPRRTSPELRDLVAALLTRDAAARITLQGISQHPWVLNCGQTQQPATPPQPFPSIIAAAMLSGQGGAIPEQPALGQGFVQPQLAAVAAATPAPATPAPADGKQGSAHSSPTGIEALGRSSDFSDDGAGSMEVDAESAPLQGMPQPALSFCFLPASSAKLRHQDTPTVISLSASAVAPSPPSFSRHSVRAPSIQAECSRDGLLAPAAGTSEQPLLPGADACAWPGRHLSDNSAADVAKRPKLAFCRFLFGGGAKNSQGSELL